MSYAITTKKTWAATCDDLDEVFERWGIRSDHYDILFDVRAVRSGRKDGYTPAERLVRVVFTHSSGKRLTFETQSQKRPVDNLRAILLAIDDMRLIEVRGFAAMVGNAYLQLQAPNPTASGMDLVEAQRLFGVRPEANLAQINAVYRVLAKDYHSDVTGETDERMARLNRAYELLKEALT